MVAGINLFTDIAVITEIKLLMVEPGVVLLAELVGGHKLVADMLQRGAPGCLAVLVSLLGTDPCVRALAYEDL